MKPLPYPMEEGAVFKIIRRIPAIWTLRWEATVNDLVFAVFWKDQVLYISVSSYGGHRCTWTTME